MDANRLRRAFTDFFAARAHVAVPSAGLIPHDPRAPLFTNAGMNQFIPYFLGEEVPPYRRATTVQKCARIRGKHDDIEVVGRTTRHLTFFEMLGNFSFGDYFKPDAIPFAWELLTGALGLDGDRLWITVFTDDDDAADIWRQAVGVPADRIQRMGEDNFWEMGDTGPCGPCSEIYFDRGPEWGAEGGPAGGGGEERYVEIWNLVFMQYDRQVDGSLVDLPRPNIDTGAGLERVLTVLQHVPSVWETDVLRPIIARAEGLCGRRYGDDAEVDVSLRILADHARSMSFLISDGVFPSNEDRGYVLRRLIRRAVRQAYRLGVERPVTPELVAATVEVMGDAYPDLAANGAFVADVAGREEQRFRATLRSGLQLLEGELGGGSRSISGDVAFRLHDTHGFPIELTRELAAERGVDLDEAGFEAAMDDQRRRAREAGRAATGPSAGLVDTYREIVEQFGPTRFVGYTDDRAESRVLSVLTLGEGRVEIFLDSTPFYAEAGGQVGDTGAIVTPTGRARVIDTTYALPGLHRHLAEVTGTVTPGQMAQATIDLARRESIRRNHTGTHLLHWALRQVLGRHVKQQGSLVAPDRLRFDFTHYHPMTAAEKADVEDLVNSRILADEPVTVEQLPRSQADRMGAIAFFEEKYGEVVRVVHAGEQSVELCGGTHVDRLGMIGPVEIVSEGSIGSNIRRLEATTGTATLERLRRAQTTLSEAAGLLKSTPEELTTAIERRLADLRAAEERARAAERAALGDVARRLAEEAAADGGAVVARRDGMAPEALRELALQIRNHAGVRAVVLGGSPREGQVTLVAAVVKGEALTAPGLIGEAARTVGGGGGGKNPELAMAGGRDPGRLDEALAGVRKVLGLA
jgi:alanyl-tRNA synthetase